MLPAYHFVFPYARAKKAEEDKLPQIAHFFRAVASAESVYARRHFMRAP